MKITTDLTGNETAIVRQARLKSVYDWYKGDGAYVAAGNLGVVRTAFNEYLASDIANLESFASWLLKFNLLNSPDTLIRTQLFGSGAKGVWFDPNDLPTLTQDSAGTVPVTAVEQPVGRMLDKSGNAAHATQAVASKRPIYGVIPKGGRRNLLTQTENLTIAPWNKLATLIAANAALDPDGAMTASKVIEDSSTGAHILNQAGLPIVAGETYTFSVYAKKAERDVININAVNGFSPSAWRFDLSAGVASLASGTATGAIESVGGGWYRCSITATATSTTSFAPFVIYLINGAAASYPGDGVSGVFVWHPQLVVGTSLGPYQRVVSAYEVTEAGVPSLPYLASDLIDDELPATVPSLGSNATVWFAVDGASTILTGQTVAAGPIATLRGARTYAMGAIDRPLTAGETAALTTYLDKARGAL